MMRAGDIGIGTGGGGVIQDDQSAARAAMATARFVVCYAIATARIVVWYDPKVHNDDNSAIQTKLREKGCSVQAFTTVDEANRILRAKRPHSSLPVKVLCISCGSSGQAFVDKVHDQPSVSGIVIFTSPSDVAKHKQWASNYSKIKDVLGNTGDVTKLVDDFFVAVGPTSSPTPHPSRTHTCPHSLAGVLLECGNPGAALLGGYMGATQSSGGSREEYYCMARDRSVAFLVVLSGMRKHTATNDEVLKEMKTLVAAPAWDNFESNWNGPWRTTEGNVTPTSLGQRLCLAYTSDYLYEALKQKLAIPEGIGEIPHFVGGFVEECNQEHAKQHLLTGATLFRGVKKKYLVGDKAKYVVGDEFYWPAFVSTSKVKESADGFSDAGGVVFKITRCARTQDLHPNVDIDANPSWGHYGAGEREVIWMPYAKFLVVSVSGTSTDVINYVDVQELPTIYNMSGSDVENNLKLWLSEDLRPQILHKMEEIFENLEPNLDLYNYFIRGRFDTDFAVIHSTFEKDNAPPTAWSMGKKVLTFGLAEDYTKIYVDKLMANLKDKLPKTIKLSLESFLSASIKRAQLEIMRLVRVKLTSGNVVPALELDNLLGLLGSSLAQNVDLHNIVRNRIRSDMAEELPTNCLTGFFMAIGALLKEILWSTEWGQKVSSKIKEAVRNDDNMKRAIDTINGQNFQKFRKAFQDFGEETFQLLTDHILRIL